MTSAASRGELSLGTPLIASAVLHAVAALGFVYSRAEPRAAAPPTYRVSLIAAPAGPRQMGVVSPPPAAAPSPASPAPAAPAPAPRAPASTPPVARETPQPDRMKAPARVPAVRTPRVATPNAAMNAAAANAAKVAPGTKPAVADPAPASTSAGARAAPAPRAGGGPQGGRGADVANVRTEGIEFPYPVYLQNVVRQIALQFSPPSGSALRSEVAFFIRRDGSISGLKLVTRSGVFSFDQDALAAVEAAARINAFGPLPEGFGDDVLPVIFSFDPRLIR